MISADEASSAEEKASAHQGVVAPLEMLYPKYCMAAFEGVKTLKTMNMNDLKQECIMRGLTDEMEDMLTSFKAKDAKRKAPYINILRPFFNREYIEEALQQITGIRMRTELSKAYESQMETAFIQVLKQELDRFPAETFPKSSTSSATPQATKIDLFLRLCNHTDTSSSTSCQSNAPADKDAGSTPQTQHQCSAKWERTGSSLGKLPTTGQSGDRTHSSDSDTENKRYQRCLRSCSAKKHRTSSSNNNADESSDTTDESRRKLF